MEDLANKTRDKVGSHIWIMRHGAPDFDYDNCTYDQFIDMLTNGKNRSLLKDHGIDFSALPSHVDLICHSPIPRALETVRELQNHLTITQVIEMDILRKARFTRDIISWDIYIYLKDNRDAILVKWYYGQNQEESFEQSLDSVKKLKLFLSSRPEKRILIVSNGWFLRLLDLHFAQRKPHIDFTDLLQVQPLQCGRSINASLELVEAPLESVSIAQPCTENSAF